MIIAIISLSAIVIALILEISRLKEMNEKLIKDKERIIAIKHIIIKKYRKNKRTNKKEIYLLPLESKLIIEEMEKINI